MALDIYNDFLLVKIENREYKRLSTEKIRNFVKVNIINEDDKNAREDAIYDLLDELSLEREDLALTLRNIAKMCTEDLKISRK